MLCLYMIHVIKKGSIHKMQKLMVTGYKPMEINIFKNNDPRINFLKAAIRKKLIEFIEEGLEWVLISGQFGVELWAGEVVLDLKSEYDIKLAIFPPFENQDSRWPDDTKELYQQLIMEADFYRPIYWGEYKGPYQFKAKNTWLINKSDACLILMDEEFPGSNRFIYEETKKVAHYPVFFITPADLNDVVTEMQMDQPEYWNE